MFKGCRVLDLCCGDGFYAYHFYADIASHVDAIDSDTEALTHAGKYHHHPKISYRQINVVEDGFPSDHYDVITWDAAIEHFLPEQIRGVLKKCVTALKTSEGILCGHTILARGLQKGHVEHQHEFSSVEELKEILGEFFPFVGTVVTVYPERDNIYFRATFDQDRLRRFT
jgi:2-polyprenyl-3-methyl-5-hydroxy-6-metoxy-1,4-benzoquinol methylase